MIRPERVFFGGKTTADPDFFKIPKNESGRAVCTHVTDSGGDFSEKVHELKATRGSNSVPRFFSRCHVK